MGTSIFEGGQGRVLATTAIIAVVLTACHAQVKAKGSANGVEAEADDRRWEVPEPTQTSMALTERPAAPERPANPEQPAEPRKEAKIAAAVTPAATPPTEGSHTTFLGVAHDLSLSTSAPRNETCRCLAVAYGSPGDAKWTWQGDTPRFEGGTIAIGISTDGVSCNGTPPMRHASIAGVEREGTDIVVFVENVSDGRPVMRGVLAPSPGPNAAIVVRTRAGASYPAASGNSSCRVVIK